MVSTQVIYKEVRFVIEGELIECYVLVDIEGKYVAGLKGWHHKTFPSSMAVVVIFKSFVEEAPEQWPLKAPE